MATNVRTVHELYIKQEKQEKEKFAGRVRMRLIFQLKCTHFLFHFAFRVVGWSHLTHWKRRLMSRVIWVFVASCEVIS
jgi:hypothetical protein